jgi:uncharacterized protein (DUF111 family)
MAMSHLHLDALGGFAGDMFTAALLDAFPAHAAAVMAAVATVTGVPCRVLAHNNGGLAGTRFCIDRPQRPDQPPRPDLRARLENAALPEAVRQHALDIRARLAPAEDGLVVLAEIVAASWLIAALGPARWSVAPLPLASVTPTGAAILRHLGNVARPTAPGRLGRSGIGFAATSGDGRANLLRVLSFDAAAATAPHRQLAVLGFEVTAQSAEALARGLDRLRARPDVHDLLQMPALGTRGRVATHVQILTRPEAAVSVARACFGETAAIDVRMHLVQGRALPREARQVATAGRSLRVKLVDRPGGRTGKVEADDVRDVAGHAARARLRRSGERPASEPS